MTRGCTALHSATTMAKIQCIAIQHLKHTALLSYWVSLNFNLELRALSTVERKYNFGITFIRIYSEKFANIIRFGETYLAYL